MYCKPDALIAPKGRAAHSIATLCVMAESKSDRSASGGLPESDTLDEDALRTMIATEFGGEGFYNALADRIDDAEAAKLLLNNGR